MDTGIASSVIFILLIIIVFFFIGKLIIKAINDPNRNTPTWKGIIISALLGLLPLYLVLCFFGLMGEERYNKFNQH